MSDICVCHADGISVMARESGIMVGTGDGVLVLMTWAEIMVLMRAVGWSQ